MIAPRLVRKLAACTPYAVQGPSVGCARHGPAHRLEVGR